MAQQGIEEDLLQRWFPLEADDKLTPFSEKDIRGIADVLIRCSRERWSRVPRLYSILKKIGQLDAIDAFIDNDLSDLSFPFSKSTLPEALREISARVKFIELQHLVYNSEALNLEQATHHGHFNDSADVPLKKVGDLGKGGYGYVDRVVSTISHREYARKQIPRGTTFRRDRQVLKDFTRELSNLRRLSHRHLVELVGSYTDKRFVAILMLPVADVNLQTFLDNTHLNERSRSLLRPFFGCLASALSYLHDNRIRHKDIKPSNVLIKDDQVYFTDFGTSLDWSGRDHSATATAPPTTPRYCAPEVMAFTERNSSSDIWSFGCVLLEMWSVLKHGTITDLKAHMVTTGTKTTSYHSNLEAIDSWVQFLRSSPGPSSDLIPSTWITNMLRHEPASRWNIHKLGNEISEACMDSSTQHSFKGICCLDLEDETSDDMESIHSDHHDHLAVPSQSQPNPSFLAKNVDVQKLGIISIQQVEHSSSDNHNIIGTEKHGIQNKIRTGDKNTSMVQKIPGRCTPQSNHRSTNMIYKQNFTDNDEMNVRPTLGKERRDSVNRIDTDSRKLKLQDNSGVEETTDTLDGSWQPLHPKQKVKTRLFGALSDSRYADYIPYIPPLRPTRRARPIYDEDEGSDTSNKAVTGIQPTVKPETHRTVSVLHSMNDSEQQAVYNFEIHARACHSCRTPWLTYTQGTAFCSTGYRLALRLLGFMCRVDGVVYSTSYKDHVATQVSISTDYSCILVSYDYVWNMQDATLRAWSKSRIMDMPPQGP
ncbi:hypothetical protein PTT_14683 [Pyrenophora teres f. teres 0-1]|uniref:Protein kinase domain-containing protein n=1 Tax=Pyrenophora teres f. teres (strain 0-1) TaxID=861557 RepID=E3RYP2_PYRTT|nr:hypothetical protein PTT_14683 [Pyrenophora teres f. teres 0-1]